VTRAGIGLTGVGSATINASQASNALVGKQLNSSAIEEAAYLAAKASNPRSDHRGSATYKRHVVGMFVERLLTGMAA
jgi:carbon-monoxide dehydrogenase medium subunit